MDGKTEASANPTKVEQISDREVVVTRQFNAPPRIVFEAWTKPEHFMRWWAPKSLGVPIRSCDMDVRTGGKYRLEFGHDAASSWTFFGKYLEVVPNAKLVWTNDEGEEGAITTVTFEDIGGKTLLTYRDLYPSKAAFDEGMGSTDGLPQQYAQLDELLGTLSADAT